LLKTGHTQSERDLIWDGILVLIPFKPVYLAPGNSHRHFCGVAASEIPDSGIRPLLYTGQIHPGYSERKVCQR